MGALESISIDGGTAILSVAGQSFNVASTEASALAIGDYVVAGAAQPSAPGVVYHVGAPYSPGISTVRVKAPVESVDLLQGRLTAGALVVDYTPHLSVDPSLAPSAGDTVEVTGTQPAHGGVLVVSSSGDGISLATLAAGPEALTAAADRR
jgi:hypothetical protein